jgi:hypothetical protein
MIAADVRIIDGQHVDPALASRARQVFGGRHGLAFRKTGEGTRMVCGCENIARHGRCPERWVAASINHRGLVSMEMTMTKLKITLTGLSLLAAGALLVPDAAQARRGGGFHGGGLHGAAHARSFHGNAVRGGVRPGRHVVNRNINRNVTRNVNVYGRGYYGGWGPGAVAAGVATGAVVGAAAANASCSRWNGYQWVYVC